MSRAKYEVEAYPAGALERVQLLRLHGIAERSLHHQLGERRTSEEIDYLTAANDSEQFVRTHVDPNKNDRYAGNQSFWDPR